MNPSGNEEGILYPETRKSQYTEAYTPQSEPEFVECIGN
jgi:hypothetical protein